MTGAKDFNKPLIFEKLSANSKAFGTKWLRTY
jgi:hypothetical protein